jgi:hypothetical protein
MSPRILLLELKLSANQRRSASPFTVFECNPEGGSTEFFLQEMNMLTWNKSHAPLSGVVFNLYK